MRKWTGVLKQDIIPPNPDRRRKYTWPVLSKIEAGTRFIVEEGISVGQYFGVPGDNRTANRVAMLDALNGCHTCEWVWQHNHEKELYNLVVGNLTPEATTVLNGLEKLGFKVVPSSLLVKVLNTLVGSGKVTLDDVLDAARKVQED